jgi:hypothetical protein
MAYEEFISAEGKKKELTPGAVSPINLKESLLTKETTYTIEESVSPNRSVIIPFYLPGNTAAIKYVYLNVYFPGLQVGDYPFNTQTLYLPAISKGSIEYKNGAFSRLIDDFSMYSGNGAAGGNYYWYRGYSRFQIAPIHGFKLTSCELWWTLGNRASAGAGVNTQHPNKLHAVNDYGILDLSDWSLATQVDYGNVNVYTDTIGAAFSKDVKTRVQALIDALTDYASFRFIGAEHGDTANANNYHLNEPQLKCVLEEDAGEPVYVSIDDGREFFLQLDYYNSNIEDVDLTRFFSGTGRKRIKFTSSKIRRINVILRIGIR